MSKLFVILVVAAFAAYVVADDDLSDDSDLPAFGSAFGGLGSLFDKPMEMGEDFIKSIVPPKMGHAAGSFHSSSSSKKMVNGKVVEDSANTKDIENNDGKVTEKDTSS